MKKSIHLLIPEDFHVSPIWQPIDDFEDPNMEVQPFQGELLHVEEIYLVASRFNLADGTEFEGYIRYSWGKPVIMALASKDGDFLLFAIERLVETEERHLEFAKKLNKKVDDVFPIKYQTSISVRLQGQVY